jgi:hypothetical protein
MFLLDLTRRFVSLPCVVVLLENLPPYLKPVECWVTISGGTESGPLYTLARCRRAPHSLVPPSTPSGALLRRKAPEPAFRNKTGTCLRSTCIDPIFSDAEHFFSHSLSTPLHPHRSWLTTRPRIPIGEHIAHDREFRAFINRIIRYWEKNWMSLLRTRSRRDSPTRTTGKGTCAAP